MKNFFGGIPFVLCSLLAPDAGTPAGGGGSAASSEKLPEPEGKTLEEKIASALGIIKDLFGKLGKAGEDLKAANDLLGTALNFENDLKTERDAHTKIKDALKAEQDAHGITKGALKNEQDLRKKSDERVILVESFAKSKGLDITGITKENALRASQQNDSGNDVWSQYQQLRTDEKTGKTAPGSAFAFYQKNQKALKEFASTNRVAA